MRLVIAALIVSTASSPAVAQLHMSLPSNHQLSARLRERAAVVDSIAGALESQVRAEHADEEALPARTKQIASLHATAGALRAAADAADSPPPGATLFGDVAAAFQTRLSYVRTSLISGRVEHSSGFVEVSYLSAISAKDSIPGLTRDSSQARIATLASIVHNSGNWGARLLWPGSTTTSLGVFAYDAIVEGGAYGTADHPMASGGLVAELQYSANIFGSDNGSNGKLILGGQGSMHWVSANRLFGASDRGSIAFGQLFGMVKANDAVAFGIAANGVSHRYRAYLPSLQLIVKADVGAKKAKP
jgi:hypothetical protein